MGDSLGSGRFADGEAHFALRHGHARDGVHDQHYIGALVAKILRDGGSDKGTVEPKEGGFIGSGHHDHRAFQAFQLRIALDEFAHFAAAFADEGDDVEIRVGVSGDHAQSACSCPRRCPP